MARDCSVLRNVPRIHPVIQVASRRQAPKIQGCALPLSYRGITNLIILPFCLAIFNCYPLLSPLTHLSSFQAEPLCYTKHTNSRLVPLITHKMRKDKVKAYELRRRGKSYKEIRKVLGIPLGTIAGWLKGEEWSRKIRDKLGAKASLAFPEKMEAIRKANKARWAKKYREYQQAAQLEFPKLHNDPLFISGLMLFWGEGNKSPKDSTVTLANSDPLMIRIFYRFLTETMSIKPEKIKLHLLLYPDLVDNMQKSFWSRATGIPLSQFIKSTYIKGRHPTRRLSYGVCSIYVCNRESKDKILAWLNMYQKLLV